MVCSSTPCVFSLSLSLSGAGEPQTFLVWGSPCVSSTWTRSPTSIRTSSSSLSPRHRSRTCFFFFSRRRRSFSVWCFPRSCLVGVGGLGGCTWSWSWSVCCLPNGAFFFFFFFWVGGIPLAAFSLRFPLGSRVWWGCVLCFLFAAL